MQSMVRCAEGGRDELLQKIHQLLDMSRSMQDSDLVEDSCSTPPVDSRQCRCLAEEDIGVWNVQKDHEAAEMNNKLEAGYLQYLLLVVESRLELDPMLSDPMVYNPAYGV